jgi:hypothetical protein
MGTCHLRAHRVTIPQNSLIRRGSGRNPNERASRRTTCGVNAGCRAAEATGVFTRPRPTFVHHHGASDVHCTRRHKDLSLVVLAHTKTISLACTVVCRSVGRMQYVGQSVEILNCHWHICEDWQKARGHRRITTTLRLGIERNTRQVKGDGQISRQIDR